MDYIEVTDEMMDEYWCVREESVSNEIARDAIRAAIAASPLYKRVQELEDDLAKFQWRSDMENAPHWADVWLCVWDEKITGHRLYAAHFNPVSNDWREASVLSPIEGTPLYWATISPLPEPPKEPTP